MNARSLALLVLAGLALPPGWLLATESGLRAAIAVAQRATGGALAVESARGRLAGEVSLVGLRYAAGATEIRVGAATLELGLLPLLGGRLSARALSIDGLAVRVAARPPANEPSPPLTVRAPLPIELAGARVRDFTLEVPGFRWALPQAELTVRWQGTRFELAPLAAETAEAGPVRLEGVFGIEAGALVFEPLRARLADGGELVAEGHYALHAEQASALRLRWTGLRGEAARLHPGLSSPRGTATLDGPAADWRWTLQAEAVAEGLPLKANARGAGDRRGIRVESARVEALGGTLDLEGALAWGPAFAAQARARWQGLDPARRWPDWPGELSGAGEVSIRRANAGWLLEFDAGLRDSTLRGYPLALQATGVRDGDAVRLARFELRSGASLLRAQGRLLPALALDGSLRSSDLASLWAGLGGSADVSLGARGSWQAPRLSARGQLTALALEGYGAARVDVDADIALAARSELRVAVTDAHGPGGRLHADTLVLEAAGTQQRHEAVLTVRANEASGRLAIAGGRAGAGWRGSLEALDLVPASGAPWALEESAALAFTRGIFELAPACLRNAGSRACAEFQTGARRQHLAFRLRDFDLAMLGPWLPQGWAVRGTLDGTAAVRLAGGELTAISADLAASPGGLSIADVNLAFGEGSLTVGPDGDRLRANLILRPAGGTVTGEVWLAPGGALLDRPMLGDLGVDLPALDWLPLLSPEIASSHGSAQAALHVSGSLRSPSLDGRVTIRDGRVALTTPGIELTQFTAAFERGRDAPLKVDVSAKSGDGTLSLSGELATLQPRVTGRFTLKGRSVLGYDTPDLRAWVSPNLLLTLDGRAARLTGTVKVPRAEITPRRGERGGIGPSGDQLLVSDVQARDGALSVESEVRVELGDDVRFDGRGLKTQLTGAITAIDRPGWPTTGHGELRLVGGRYKAYGQDLTIETGRLVFPGGPIDDPAIDLSAYRQVNVEIRVGLRARGTLAKPEFSLYSTPAMAQEEQLSWLVLGRPLSTNLNPGQRSELSGAAVALGLSGGDYIAGRLAPRLGLDEVSVSAQPGEATDLARFTIGKYLSPRLFLSYGVGLFQPGQFVKLTYDLGRRFKLSGESGIQQGGDLLYSIER